MQERSIRRVAVVGTGTIGISWAATFLSRGLAVSATDPAPDAEARLRQFIDAAWPVLARLGPTAATPPHHLLIFCADPETAVAGADFVQENAPEREATKQQLLARIDAALPPEIVIASSSSGLLMSRLQEPCRHPTDIPPIPSGCPAGSRRRAFWATINLASHAPQAVEPASRPHRGAERC